MTGGVLILVPLAVASGALAWALMALGAWAFGLRKARARLSHGLHIHAMAQRRATLLLALALFMVGLGLLSVGVVPVLGTCLSALGWGAVFVLLTAAHPAWIVVWDDKRLEGCASLSILRWSARRARLTWDQIVGLREGAVFFEVMGQGGTSVFFTRLHRDHRALAEAVRARMSKGASAGG